MSFSAFFENFILKKRSIFEYRKTISGNDFVSCQSMVSLDVDALLQTADDRLAHYLRIRRGMSQWVFFSLWDDECLKGYSFLHTPDFEEWNDSLPTLPGEARVSSNFVYPEYRGRGVRAEIFAKQCEYAQSIGLKLWAVVEDRNLSSIRAEKKVGFISRKNYLVKFLGRNVVSILTNPIEIYALLGVRRGRR